MELPVRIEFIKKIIMDLKGSNNTYGNIGTFHGELVRKFG